MSATIKALPLWQPYASLVALGAKRVETRDYAPWRLGLQFGQRIAIHATKTPRDPSYLGLAYYCALDHFHDHVPDPDMLPLGALLCTCVLDRAREITAESAAALERRNPQEHAFGYYEPGRWAWVLRDIERLPEPVPYRGSQGAFDVPLSILGEVVHEPVQGALL